MEKKIIAIFGGSFNPPSIAHLNLAKQILKIKNIEKVIFMPVSTRYNKNGLASDEDRYNWLKCICDSEKGLEVSRVELNSKKQLYTLETLRIIQNQYKDKDIYFILGTDNLRELETWYMPNKILEEFKIIVLERNEDSANDIIQNSKFLQKYRTSILIPKGIQKINISSTYIREQLMLKKSIDGLVPEQIKKMINLFRM